MTVAMIIESKMYSSRDGHIAVILLAFSCCVTLAFSRNVVDKEIPESSILRGAVYALKAGELTDSCRDELTRFTTSLTNGEPWALNMADASSKLQSGILRGNIRDMGMYDQCVQIRKKDNAANVQGRHCMVSMSLSLPRPMNDTLVSSRRIVESAGRIIHPREESSNAISIGLTSSICVPSACGPDDAVGIINAIISTITHATINTIFNTTLDNDQGLRALNGRCSSVTTKDMLLGEMLTITLMGTVGVIIVSCTIFDVLLRSKTIEESSLFVTLAKFSLLTNGAALFSTRVTPNMMPSLQGMRFLSMCWVVIGHRYLLTLLGPQVNLLDVLDWHRSWHAMYILAAPFAVDTFFVISGFLMTYLFLTSMRSGGRMNVPMLYLHRYLRLTPAVGIMILITTFLLPRFGSGAIWETGAVTLSKGCKNTWWRYLLYVQNYVQSGGQCLPHAWYLAVDMQLFWISPFILYPMHRWPKYGFVILWLLLIASIVTPATILAVNRYTNVLIDTGASASRIVHEFHHFYVPTHCRATAYFVGMFLGFEVATIRRTLSKTNATGNWILAGCMLLFCVVGLRSMYLDTYIYNIYWETVYAALSRLFWSIGIAWIVFASTQGYGGPITKFLSLPIFLPLSRLSYCIYLIHLIFQYADVSSSRVAGYFSDYQMFSTFWADLMIVIALAVPFSLFFESPIIVLEKILSRSGSNSSPAPTPILERDEVREKHNEAFQP